jgi:GNAT superfamily N-acetyltransferase
MEKLIIRQVRKDELKEVAKVYAKVFTEFNVNERWSEESAINLLICLFSRQSDLCFVADINGKIVGGYFATIKPWWDGNHLIDAELFVDSSYRKEGIGKKLSIKMYETALKRYNISLIEASTFKNRKFPMSWHKSIGLKESKELILIEGNPSEMLKNLRNH